MLHSGVRFLGAHVPVSVCTPSRYALLTGRLPSSAPFYSGTRTGHFDAEGTVDTRQSVSQSVSLFHTPSKEHMAHTHTVLLRAPSFERAVRISASNPA